MWKRNCPIIHMHRFPFFFFFFLIFLVHSHHSANELKNMRSVKTECWLQKVWKSLRLDSVAKNVLRVDRLFWKHMHFLTSGSLVFLMGFGSLCLSPDTTLQTALTSTGTPLDDWSWHLAFLVGKGGFRYAPKRLPVWHRLRLVGLARVGQNHKITCVDFHAFSKQLSSLDVGNQMTERCSQAMLGHRRYTLSESRRWRILRLPSSMYMQIQLLPLVPLPPSSMSCPLL